MRRGRLLLPLIFALLLAWALLGCDDVEPAIVGTPTPSASPTPLPDPFTAEITAAPRETDALGNEIVSEDHYFQYLSFGDIRVYEYGAGTFLDGVCVNAFPQALDGRVDVMYYNGDGKLCGQGTLHNAEGGTTLSTGTNPVYAEIRTDIDVKSMDFVLEVVTSFAPVTEKED